MNIADFFDLKAVWPDRTFGPGPRSVGLVAHIRSELDEITQSPHSLEEWVDVVLLAMDGAHRCAHADGHEFVEALRAKHAKNTCRTWPPPSSVAADEPTFHIKDPT